MRVAFVCVNYGSDDHACRFVRSIARAGSEHPNADVAVFLVDNTERPSPSTELRELAREHTWLSLLVPGANLGYFGGAHFACRDAGLYDAAPDFLVVSNVDLELDPLFIRSLDRAYPENVGVIAPGIFSLHRGRDLNPKIRSRPSVARIRFLEWVFRHPSAYWAYSLLSQAKDRLAATRRGKRSGRAAADAGGQPIYAPHGSLIVFRPQFFARGGSLEYAGFLFGEEVFVAEELRRLDLQPVHDPVPRVIDSDHASTGQLPSTDKARMHASSMRFLRHRYFEPAQAPPSSGG